MGAFLTTPTGEIVENPDQDDLARTLDALLASDDPEADLWLENEEGWALSVVPTRDLFFEHLDQPDYYTLGPLERDYILRLLHLLSQNKLEELQAEPWEKGE